MPTLSFTDLTGTGNYEACILNTQFSFMFPGATLPDQINSARALVNALSGDGDLSAAEDWIFRNLAFNPLAPGNAWTRAEAISVMQTMMDCDSLDVGGEVIVAAVYAVDEGLEACDTLGDVVENGADDFVSTVLEIMMAL
ncbi:MAG: hypothetical protein AB7S41_05040 [Parvibaculaceae bacterium]